MTGEKNLATILNSLSVTRRDEPVTMVSVTDTVALSDGILAVISEGEGTTAVATLAEAKRRSWPIDFEATWLTIDVHSSLEAVGLTAALSVALAERGIPCNVIAGFYHDHLLVPVARTDEAIQVITALNEQDQPE